MPEELFGNKSAKIQPFSVTLKFHVFCPYFLGTLPKIIYLILNKFSHFCWVFSINKSMRSRKPFHVNLMLGGYDDIEETPTLHHIDYMGADVRLKLYNLYIY